MLFASRSRRGRDRYLQWKILLLALGAGVGLLGMSLENRWLLGSAMAILLLAMVLRLLPQPDQPEPNDDDAG